MGYVKKLDINSISYDIKSVATEDVNTGNAIKIWTGTRAEYDAITTKDGNTLYNTDNGLFLGTIEVANKFSEVSATSSRNVGEIVMSTVPLSNAGLHPLDGSPLQYGSYKAFIDYIAEIYNSGDYLNLFITEEEWRQSVTNYGVCGKFVYDSANNTVRLPKYGTQIITKTPSVASTVPVIGNGMTLGLTSGSSTASLLQGGDDYVFSKSYYGKTLPYNSATTVPSGQRLPLGTGLGVTTDAAKSGIIAVTSSLLTDYPLDCYYYIVLATSTKTDIEVDIDEIATDLNGKMDIDGTNAVSSVKFADGQWVASYLELSTTTTAGSRTHDLTSYLPTNDDYEIYISMYAQGSSAGSLAVGNMTSPFTNKDTGFMGLCSVGSNSLLQSNTFIIPVSNRTLYSQITTNLTNVNIWLLGYRRLGTNQ